MTIPGALIPWIEQRFLDANGDPLASGQVASYIVGTDTPKALYTDSDLTVPHANPVILDAEGRPPAPIFVSPGGYKFVVSDADDVVLYTVDDVEDIGSTWLARWGLLMAEGAANVESGYQVLASDRLVTVASTGGADPCLINLLSAAAASEPLCIKNVGTVALSIVPYLADTIDGIAGALTIPVATASLCPSIWIVPDGVSNWWIFAANGLGV
jgi:hypothetical protein